MLDIPKTRRMKKHWYVVVPVCVVCVCVFLCACSFVCKRKWPCMTWHVCSCAFGEGKGMRAISTHTQMHVLQIW